ncbi:hypothetical protein ACFRJ8_05400 [Arthrobacter sp. NPDC056886]|uniref:hypothetical protein n=1 Tax=Arthrobacter sp. NPDC056886 TaxID=3345960 RepID=UPI003670E080
MSGEQRDKPAEKRFFPSVGGVVAGLVPGIFALFTDVSQPFWIFFKVILVAAALGFAAANMIGLAVVKHRRSTKDGERGIT